MRSVCHGLKHQALFYSHNWSLNSCFQISHSPLWKIVRTDDVSWFYCSVCSSAFATMGRTLFIPKCKESALHHTMLIRGITTKKVIASWLNWNENESAIPWKFKLWIRPGLGALSQSLPNLLEGGKKESRSERPWGFYHSYHVQFLRQVDLHLLQMLLLMLVMTIIALYHPLLIMYKSWRRKKRGKTWYQHQRSWNIKRRL